MQRKDPTGITLSKRICRAISRQINSTGIYSMQAGITFEKKDGTTDHQVMKYTKANIKDACQDISEIVEHRTIHNVRLNILHHDNWRLASVEYEYSGFLE